MRTSSILLVSFLWLAGCCFAQGKGLLIDDFEGEITGGPDGTIDFGSGGGSNVEVAGETNVKHSGYQSLKVTYDAIASGYMWVARGFELDAKNTAWLIKPGDIDWKKYNSFSFYMYGSDNKARIAFDIKDNGNEFWRFMVTDDFKGWKEIICPFSEFFARGDWQPGNSDKNAELNFPIKSFQFEPRPEAKGILYFDMIELINK